MNGDRSNVPAGTNDTISGADVLRFVRNQFWWIAGFFILGAVAGIVIALVSPQQWEAKSMLQIGQIDDGAPAAAGTTGLNPIDPPSRAAERIKVKSFKDQVLQTLSLPVDQTGDARSKLIRKTLVGEIVPNTDLLQISVRAFSPDQAKAALAAAQTQLIAIHQTLVDDALKRLHDHLNDLDTEIANARAKRSRLDAAADVHSQGGVSGGQEAVNVLLGNMLDVSNTAVLAEAQRRRAEVATELSPDHTYNTKALGEIAVSDGPVAPRRAVYVMLGALLGLVIGLLVASMRSTKR